MTRLNDKGVLSGMGSEGNESKYNNCLILMKGESTESDTRKVDDTWGNNYKTGDEPEGESFDEFGNKDTRRRILEVEIGDENGKRRCRATKSERERRDSIERALQMNDSGVR